MTPIQTDYHGFKFRSRGEARWAVFFDTLGLKYQYEPEGFSLPPVDGDGEPINYLPDFLIPAQRQFPQGLWVEVKGVTKTVDDEKVSRLAAHTKTRATILPADIPFPQDIDSDFGNEIFSFELCNLEWPIFLPCGGSDCRYTFCECPFCGALGFEFDGRSARIGCGCKQHAGIGNGNKTFNNASARLMRAYHAARSARFEWGEHGATV